MHVLIVEPDKQLANNLTAALEAKGHTASRAVSAQTAVHEIDNQVPDAIVLELHLKKHNGVEFLYELRSYREWHQIPVIVWSFAHPDKFVSNEELLQQLGIVDYLYKPAVSLEQVVATVQRTQQPVLS